MDISNQIRMRRQAMGLSQDELAGRIYVSRQTVSNWETDRTYPDVQSLLLLSALFDTSIDTLVKGDIEIMEKKVVSADAKRMNLFTAIMVTGLVLMIPFGILGVNVFGDMGVMLALLPWLPAMAASVVVQSITRKNDVYTYQEILAFVKGEPIDRSKRSAWARRRAAVEHGPLWKRVLLGVILGLVAAAIGGAVGYFGYGFLAG